jgi:hypothetical protein
MHVPASLIVWRGEESPGTFLKGVRQMAEEERGFGLGFGSNWIWWLIIIIVVIILICPGIFGGFGGIGCNKKC